MESEYQYKYLKSPQGHDSTLATGLKLNIYLIKYWIESSVQHLLARILFSPTDAIITC